MENDENMIEFYSKLKRIKPEIYEAISSELPVEILFDITEIIESIEIAFNTKVERIQAILKEEKVIPHIM